MAKKFKFLIKIEFIKNFQHRDPINYISLSTIAFIKYDNNYLFSLTYIS